MVRLERGFFKAWFPISALNANQGPTATCPHCALCCGASGTGPGSRCASVFVRLRITVGGV